MLRRIRACTSLDEDTDAREISLAGSVPQWRRLMTTPCGGSSGCRRADLPRDLETKVPAPSVKASMSDGEIRIEPVPSSMRKSPRHVECCAVLGPKSQGETAIP